MSHSQVVRVTRFAAGSCFGHRCRSEGCAEGAVGTNGTRTSIKSAVHREVTQIPDMLRFLVFPNMALEFTTKIITTAANPSFYCMNAFTLFWLNVIFYDNIQQSFSINFFQVYASYNLLKKVSMWGGSHCLGDIKMHWHLANVNLSGLWLLLYSQARFPRFCQSFGDSRSCSIKLGPSFKYSGNWTCFKP